MRNHWLSVRASRLMGDSVPRQFFLVAMTAMLVDLATKAIAVRTLGPTGVVEIAERLSLLLVWNTGVAGGMSVGPFTAQLNMLMTASAILLVVSVVRAVAAIDARATFALGLVTGGALGNLASIVGGRDGVADFIGMHLWGGTTIVANVADFMLWGGALMLAPVARTLVRQLRLERAEAAALSGRFEPVA